MDKHFHHGLTLENVINIYITTLSNVHYDKNQNDLDLRIPPKSELKKNPQLDLYSIEQNKFEVKKWQIYEFLNMPLK